MDTNGHARRVTVLSGVGGGARLAHGFATVTDELTVVVNTADDSHIYGLSISPDLDTVIYTLAGLIDPAKGWGRADETFTALEALRALGEDTWFTLGDKDLATHIVRTQRLRAGDSLSTITAQMCGALGVRARVLPMSDDAVATRLETASGHMGFQEYFVRRRHADPVYAVEFDGIDAARPAPGVVEALSRSDIVILGPSNPFVSIGPILAVPGVRDALAATSSVRAAISPLIGGRVVKGPAADMLATLGHEVSAVGIAQMYEGLVDVFVIDDADSALAGRIKALGLQLGRIPLHRVLWHYSNLLSHQSLRTAVPQRYIHTSAADPHPSSTHSPPRGAYCLREHGRQDHWRTVIFGSKVDTLEPPLSTT